MLTGLLVMTIPAAARAESFMLACESRSEKAIGPTGAQIYDRPITLSVDTDSQVIKLLTDSGAVWRTTEQGVYPTQKNGTLRGPLRVEITELAYEWGAPLQPDRKAYLANFDGVINRLTGSARIFFMQDSRDISSRDFVGACRKITGPKL